MLHLHHVFALVFLVEYPNHNYLVQYVPGAAEDTSKITNPVIFKILRFMRSHLMKQISLNFIDITSF